MPSSTPPPVASPSLHNSWLPVAWAAGTTWVTALTCQSLLLAVALGSSDYVTGRPGLDTGALRGWSALVMALATFAGATVARHRLRWVGLAPGAQAVLTGAGPSVAMAAIAGFGLVRHADLLSVLVMVLGGLSGIAGVLLIESRRRAGDQSR